MQFEYKPHRFRICNLHRHAKTVIQKFLLSSKSKYIKYESQTNRSLHFQS